MIGKILSTVKLYLILFETKFQIKIDLKFLYAVYIEHNILYKINDYANVKHDVLVHLFDI